MNTRIQPLTFNLGFFPKPRNKFYWVFSDFLLFLFFNSAMQPYLILCLSIFLSSYFFPLTALAHWPSCFYEAANKYGINSELLLAIAEVESEMNACAVGVNKDGSKDLGLMQINSWWLPKLDDVGISKQRLFDPCINTEVAAWILQDSFKRYGYGWKAVGAYNAGTGTTEKTEINRKLYAKKIADQLQLNSSISSELRLNRLRQCQ